MRSKKGFTLIELIVTMAVSGIFFTLAMNMFSTANGSFVSYKKAHEAYFDYNVKKAIANRMLNEHQGTCDNQGNFHFSGDSTRFISADSLDKAFPFPSPKCRPVDKKRTLVYYLGVPDSSSREVQGYSSYTRH